jgi:hypothetical protein
MIVFNLLSHNENLSKLACKEILQAGFALEIFLDENIHEVCFENNTVVQHKLFKLAFITKARLFDDIERLLTEKIPKNDFRFYSNPVTQIDVQEGLKIRTQLTDGLPPGKSPTNPS